MPCRSSCVLGACLVVPNIAALGRGFRAQQMRQAHLPQVAPLTAQHRPQDRLPNPVTVTMRRFDLPGRRLVQQVGFFRVLSGSYSLQTFTGETR
jgi:hypothetical protein